MIKFELFHFFFFWAFCLLRSIDWVRVGGLGLVFGRELFILSDYLEPFSCLGNWSSSELFSLGTFSESIGLPTVSPFGCSFLITSLVRVGGFRYFSSYSLCFLPEPKKLELKLRSDSFSPSFLMVISAEFVLEHSISLIRKPKSAIFLARLSF